VSIDAQRVGRDRDVGVGRVNVAAPRLPPVVDLHTHVLPGIDDGPADLDGSRALADLAVASGTTTLVATPHVTWDLPRNTAEQIAGGVGVLREVGLGVDVRTGGEVAITRGVELPDHELTALRLGGGEWLLCECPLTSAAVGFDTLLLQLQGRGHRVVLAHPERSPAVQRDPAVLERLIGAGMLSSITAGSLTGQFGRTVQAFTYNLLEQGLVHNVASDAHDAVRRPPGMRDQILAAAEELPGLEDQLEWLTLDVPRAVIDGGPIPRRPVHPPKRRKRRPRWLGGGKR